MFSFLLSSDAYSQTLKIGDEAHGGIIAYIDDTGKHGLVCSLKDMGFDKWEEAKTKCNNYSFMGKTDWYLPSKFELNLLYENLHMKGLGGFANGFYWSSTENDANFAWLQDFGDGYQGSGNKGYHSDVFAVRAF